MPDVEVKINDNLYSNVDSKLTLALLRTTDGIKTNVQTGLTMPFDTGELQNRSMFVDSSQAESNKVAYIVNDTPYARRLYFHPEYNFDQTCNPQAGAQWFEPYVSGDKKDYAQELFKERLKEL